MRRGALWLSLGLGVAIGVLAGFGVQAARLVDNIDAIKGIGSFCASIVSVGTAATALAVAAVGTRSVQGTRMQRAVIAGAVLVSVGVLGYVLAILSLEYAACRSWAFAVAAMLCVYTVAVFVGVVAGRSSTG